MGGTATYLSRVGIYTKIGRIVEVQCFIQISTIGTGSTTLISGLPFQAINTASADAYMAAAPGNASATSVTGMVGNVQANQTTIQLLSYTAAAAAISVNAIFQANTSVTAGGCYTAT